MKQSKTWILYVIPSVLLFSIFTIFPFVKTVVQSFCLAKVTGEVSGFTGLSNFTTVLSESSYIDSLLSTLKYTIITVPFTVVISLMLAVLSFSNQKGMGIFRTIFSSTMGISVAAGSVFWKLLFHPTAGVLNRIIEAFGGESIGWLTDPKYAIFSISAVSIWMNIGFSYLVLMGGLKSIDASHYESVEIVGGGFFYRLRKVTLPLISPSLYFVVTVSLIGSFQAFGVVDMLTSGGPMNSTNLLVYRLYKDGFVNFRYGPTAAQGMILFILIFIVSKIQTRFTEGMVTYQ